MDTKNRLVVTIEVGGGGEIGKGEKKLARMFDILIQIMFP